MSSKDLADKVADALGDVSPAHKKDFEENFKGKKGTIEELNRHFRVELSALPVDTIDARECLISGISEKTWLSYFSNHVVRPITKHKVLS